MTGGLAGPVGDRAVFMAWMAFELQDLVGQLQQLLVLLLFLLDRLPPMVGQDLAFLVGSVLADHDKGRQKIASSDTIMVNSP